MGDHRFRLACIPYAGSGAGFYRAWKKLDVTDVEVIPLQLPGREERFVEPLQTDLSIAAKALAADALRAAKDKSPIALFGHSLGAALAYELARELLPKHPALVCHLFVSGSPGPWTRRTLRATGLEDGEFLARVIEFAGVGHEAFNNPDLREILLPVLRADVAMHEDYAPTPHAVINIPITAVRGADDRLVSRSQLEEWRAATSARFAIAELPGGHMYLADRPSAVLELVGRALCDRPETE
jgi:surfactin synthase thioesterase subunit